MIIHRYKMEGKAGRGHANPKKGSIYSMYFGDRTLREKKPRAFLLYQ